MPRRCEISAWLRGHWMSMGQLASPLCARWRQGRFAFLARTLLLRSVGLPGRMVGRQRNRWERFGFVWLGVAVVRTRAQVRTRAVVPWAAVLTLAAVLGA